MLRPHRSMIERRLALGPGHCALITGASHGLGLALARQCAARGMDLILAALPDSGLDARAEELATTHGVSVRAEALDLTADGGTEALADALQESATPLALLANNAGVSCIGRFETTALERSENCILLNDLALVRLTRRLLSALRQEPPSYVLNVASLAAFFSMPLKPVYAASKAFVLNFSLALAQDLRGSGVQVSVLCPGAMLTHAGSCAQVASGGLLARQSCLDPSQVADYALRQMLRGRELIIPGWINRLAATLGRVAPRPVAEAVISSIFERRETPSNDDAASTHRASPSRETLE